MSVLQTNLGWFGLWILWGLLKISLSLRRRLWQFLVTTVASLLVWYVILVPNATTLPLHLHYHVLKNLLLLAGILSRWTFHSQRWPRLQNSCNLICILLYEYSGLNHLHLLYCNFSCDRLVCFPRIPWKESMRSRVSVLVIQSESIFVFLFCLFFHFLLEWVIIRLCLSS